MNRIKKNGEELDRLKKAVGALEHALTFLDKAKRDEFYFSGISKTYEVCLEYAWKYLKQRATEEGLEVFSPKEAIKIAGRIGIIDNVEKWFDFLEDRNLAVHDYLGVSDEDYLKTIREFLIEVKKIIT